MSELKSQTFRFTLRTALAVMTVVCLWLAAAAVLPVLAATALLPAALVFQLVGISLGSPRLFLVGALFWLPFVIVVCCR